MTTTRKIALVALAGLLIVLIYFLSPILTPFLTAALLAYLGDPVARFLMRLKIPRTLAALLVIVGFIVVLALFCLLFIPILVHQIQIGISYFPAILTWLEKEFLPWVNQYVGSDIKINSDTLKNAATQNLAQTGPVLNTIWKTASKSGLFIFELALNLVLVPVVTFYLLRDWNKLVSGCQSLLPRQVEPTVAGLVRECNDVLGAFLRGQLLVMLALGLIYALGLTFAGLSMGFLIGILAGLASIVPYLGFIVGITIAGIAVLIQYHDIAHLIYILIVFSVGQTIEGMVLTPWLVGDRIGLHPVAVIFAIMAGGVLFGFVGVLLALPAAAVIMVVVRHFKDRYMQSALYEKKNG